MSVTPRDGRHAARPLERLKLLCDAGTLDVMRSRVTSRRMQADAREGDGVVGALGRIDGRPVACYAQDAHFAGGSLGEAQAGTIVRLLRLAGQAGLPVVSVLESGGARLQEGVAALGGFGRVFAEMVSLEGRVPQVAVVAGVSAGGSSYSAALADFVVMTDSGRMFLTGPAVVREAVGEAVGADELGGPQVHERNGLCHVRARTDVDAVRIARELLGFLPAAGRVAPRRDTTAPLQAGDPSAGVPYDGRRAYDIRSVAAVIADPESILELAPRWARNVVTAFVRLDGRPVGLVANQPRHLGGVIDADAAEKAARFVRLCDRFGLPLLVLVDTPGFMPGLRQERIGVIRRGAELLRAFAAARVPRVSVIVRKAFGGAYITMNSQELGASLTFAWPHAQIGVMAARSAVGIVHRRDVEAAADPERALAELAARYEGRHVGALAAAREGFIDEVIEPSATRARVAGAFDALDAPASLPVRAAGRSAG